MGVELVRRSTSGGTASLQHEPIDTNMPPRTTKRKRSSHPATPGSSPRGATRRARTQQPAEEQEQEEEEESPTLVHVDGAWSVLVREQREQGLFVDATLAVGGVRIRAHRTVLAAHSPYIMALFTSGLAESTASSETPIVLQGVDGAAVAAIVDCMYTGELSLLGATAYSVIHAANMLQVGSCEKAACAFFVERLEPSTALDALDFAIQMAAGGAHGHELKQRILAYVHEHFSECVAQPGFVELPCERIAELVSSDKLNVAEEGVLAAVRKWFEHDKGTRHRSLEKLVPLIRFPLLPVEVQLKLHEEPVMVHMMSQNKKALVLGMQLLTECRGAFARMNPLAHSCVRLQRRVGSKFVFSKYDTSRYRVGEGGALVTAEDEFPGNRVVLCHQYVMSAGKHCAEFTLVSAGTMAIGLARPDTDVKVPWQVTEKQVFGVGETGQLYGLAATGGEECSTEEGAWDGAPAARWWEPDSEADAADGTVLRMLLDMDIGTLTIKKNGKLCGPTGVIPGIYNFNAGEWCWAVVMADEYRDADLGDRPIGSVRIKAMNPSHF